MSERSVRNYCAKGRVNGAFLAGKTWNIPEKRRETGAHQQEKRRTDYASGYSKRAEDQ